MRAPTVTNCNVYCHTCTRFARSRDCPLLSATSARSSSSLMYLDRSTFPSAKSVEVKPRRRVLSCVASVMVNVLDLNMMNSSDVSNFCMTPTKLSSALWMLRSTGKMNPRWCLANAVRVVFMTVCDGGVAEWATPRTPALGMT